MKDSKIGWTNHTFNAWSGCSEVSEACNHCYARELARRAPKSFGGWGKGMPRKRTSMDYWRQPARWNAQAKASGQRTLVFVNSLSDWLDDEVPPEWQNDLLRLIEANPHLTFQLLTKRLENWQGVMANAVLAAIEMAHEWVNGRPPANVWLGTTVEDQHWAGRRIPELIRIPARIRFLSCEPLLGRVDLSEWLDIWWNQTTDQWVKGEESGIHWVIAGGESGPQARPMHQDWVRSLRAQCRRAGVPFFFKQWGEYRPAADGAAPESMPRASWVDIHGRHYSLEENLDAVRLPANRHNRFCLVERTGKKAAGRLLDGVEHSEFPQPCFAA